MKILTAAQMKAIDRRTIEEIGIPVTALMENAGRAVADAVESIRASPHALLIVCGRGHNGGDGLVAARHLANRGHDPTVVLLGKVEDLRSPVVKGHAEALQRQGIPLLEVDDKAALARAPWDRAGSIVDAIFGTGFRPPPEGLAAEAIAAITEARARGAQVIAVDLPSGLDADSGVISALAITADVTVTFAAPKLAHFSPPAEQRCGRLVVADISIPKRVIDQEPGTIDALDDHSAAALLRPERPREGHKGSFGHLLIVAGSRGKTGAAVLAARAALRSGVGLVTVATAASSLPLVAAGAHEVMTEPLPETADGTVARAAHARLLALASARTAVALGPGLTTHAETAELVRSLWGDLPVAAVFDADALNALDALPAPPPSREAARVITPHPGEAGRLLNLATAEVQADRRAAVERLAVSYHAVAVLKGYRTMIVGDDARYMCLRGNPGLATAGTGDALTGIVGSLLAQSYSGEDAAALAVHLHALAGDLAATRLGEPSLIASDVIEALPLAFRTLREIKPRR